jgi:hypothetical protein
MPVPQGYTLDAAPKLPAGYTLDSPSTFSQSSPEQTSVGVSKSAPQQGFFSSALDSSGLSSLGSAIAHPIDTLKSLPSAVSGMIHNTTDNVSQGIADYKKSGLSNTTRRDFGRSVPVLGPVLARAQEQHDEGNNAGMAGTLTGFVGGMALPEAAIKGVRGIPEASRSLLAGDISKPMGIAGVSPLERFNSAKMMGVKLDAADATNSGILKGIKKVNENSLLGSGTYEGNRLANTENLHSATNRLLDSMSPTDRESGGKAIQAALLRDQMGLKTGAEEGFQRLTEETKGQPMAGAPEVGKQAKTLLNTIAPLAEKYPSLAPSKTMSILSDLSSVGKVATPKSLGFLDSPGSEFAVPKSPTLFSPDTFSDLQRLRSATHDLTTTNPDLVKSQAIAPLQQMTHSLDSAMTDAAGGLTPAQTEVFRAANAKWADMKDTYDNPSSPLHWAVRTDAPAKLVSGENLGDKTPEVLRALKPRLGNDIAPLQRGILEGALKTTSDGAPNYKNFGLQLNRIPADYRQELYNPLQQATIGHIANTSNVLGKDFNPSGSGKLGQGIAEGAALLHPATMAIPLAQYPVAKLMNSPKFVDWLMKTPQGSVELPRAVKALRAIPTLRKRSEE